MMERRRALPSWMATKQEKEKEPLKSRRKRKVARAVFYCMNEKELVEAAVSCLSNENVGEVAGETTVKITEKCASSNTNKKPVTEALKEDSDDALETTYVSETDLDITEVETLPYNIPQHQGPESQRSGPVQDHSAVTKNEQEAEKREECPQTEADAVEEDDALRLVREIFFT